MEIKELIIIVGIAVSTIMQVIAYYNGDIKKAKRIENKRKKALEKLQAKHTATESQYIKEEEQIKVLKNEIEK